MKARHIVSIAVRVAFVVGVIAFAAWSFRDDWPAIGSAIANTAPARIALAALLWAIALSLTLPVWLLLTRAYGHDVPARQAARILFVGQLGKYIPGSVWSVGAQAQLSREYRVPARTGVAIGLIYIGIHLASSLGVAGAAVLFGALVLEVPPWLGGIALGVALCALLPPSLNWIGRTVAGQRSAPRLGWRSCAAITLLMLATWCGWGASVAVLIPTDSFGINGPTASDLLLILGAVSLSYAGGLVAIFAPAGLGVREGLLIALLSPVCGVPVAAAVAALARIIGTLIDFLWAGMTHLIGRGRYGARE